MVSTAEPGKCVPNVLRSFTSTAKAARAEQSGNRRGKQAKQKEQVMQEANNRTWMTDHRTELRGFAMDKRKHALQMV